MKKFIAAAAAAAFMLGTTAAMAAGDSAGGNGPQGSTGSTAEAPSQPEATANKMKAPATTGVGIEDKDAKKGNVSAKSPADSKTIPNVK